MFIVFSPIWKANTKITFVYNFVAPLKVQIIVIKFSEIQITKKKKKKILDCSRTEKSRWKWKFSPDQNFGSGQR